MLLLLNSLSEVVRKSVLVNIDVVSGIHDGRVTTARSFNNVAVLVVNLSTNVHMRVPGTLGVSQVPVGVKCLKSFSVV